MKRQLMLVLMVLSLTGCFLTQKEPKPPGQPAVAPFSGMVALEDVQGATSGGGITAQFGRVKPTQSVAAAFRRAADRADRATNDGPWCEIRKGQKQREGEDRDSSFMSVGHLYFGPALQNQMYEVPEQADHHYEAGVPAGFPPGLYQLKADGLAEIPKFLDLLSLPESLVNVSANGMRFELGAVKLKKGQPVHLEWNTPLAFNDQNLILMDLRVETATEIYSLRCSARERVFMTTLPTIKWDLPSSVLDKMPVSTKGKIYFIRGHRRVSRSNNVLTGDYQGLRTYFTLAGIEN